MTVAAEEVMGLFVDPSVKNKKTIMDRLFD